MTVIDSHRLIWESWTLGRCENCKGNPKKVKMANGAFVSGDPDGKYRSSENFWMCPKCGYSRRL